MDRIRQPLMRGGYRGGFAVVGLLVLVALLLIPVGLIDVGRDVARKVAGNDFLVALPEGNPTTFVDVQILSLDATDQLASLRVTGLHLCERDCAYKETVVFYSLADKDEPDEFAESASLALTPNVTTSGTVKLPYGSDLYRYPFDREDLVLGVAVERVGADGTTTRPKADETRAALAMQVRNTIPRFVLQAPQAIDPTTVRPTRLPDFDYAHVSALALERPLYLQMVIVCVLLFVTALAAYVVLLRPFDQIVAGAVGLALGTWGTRALLLGNIPNDVTLVDIYLIGLVFFALLTAVARSLNTLHQQGELRIPGFDRKAAAATTRPCPECEADIPATARRCRFCTAPVTPIAITDAEPEPETAREVAAPPVPPVPPGVPLPTFPTTPAASPAPPGVPRLSR